MKYREKEYFVMKEAIRGLPVTQVCELYEFVLENYQDDKAYAFHVLLENLLSRKDLEFAKAAYFIFNVGIPYPLDVKQYYTTWGRFKLWLNFQNKLNEKLCVYFMRHIKKRRINET